MMRNSCARALAFAVLILLALPLAAATRPQQEKSESTPRPDNRTSVRYEIRFMDLHAAEVMAWDQCSDKERCRVASLAVGGDSRVKGYLEVTGDPSTQEKIARALAREDATPRTQSFQLLLLAASTKSGNSAPEVPASAQKALADLRGFLPFKSYELLDSAWLRVTQDNVTEGRVVGRQGVGYRIRLRFRAVGGAADKNLFVDFFNLGEEPAQPRPPSADKEGTPTAPRAARDLISTTFGLKSGETIVVGTSKIDGSDEALVALLTAVPSP